MKKSVKLLIKIAALLAFFVLGAPFMTVAIWTVVALKGVDFISGIAERIYNRGVSARADVDRQQLARVRAIHRENTRKQFFDERTGCWRLEALPHDMYPSAVHGDSVFFNCSGVENVVKGTFLGSTLFGRQKVRFSMELNDPSKVEEMSNYIAANGLVGTTIRRLDNRKFEVVSDNAVDINAIVKEFYPPKTMTVEREIRKTNQYIVDGCKSYEEAVDKFTRNRFGYEPCSTFYVSRDTVDGVPDHEVRGSGELQASCLHAGQYIINETTSKVYSRNVTFSGGLDCTDEAMRSMAVDAVGRVGEDGEVREGKGFNESEDLVEDRCIVEPQLSDGLDGKEPERVISCGDRSYLLTENREEAFRDAQAYMILRFGSLDELRSVAAGENTVQGKTVLVSTVMPDPREGEFVLSVPVDRTLAESLRLTNVDTEALAVEYRDCGVSPQEIRASCMLGELCEQGYASAQLVDNPEFGGALVNGVPLSELNTRIDDMVDDGVTESFESRKQAESWLRDAEKIQSVNMELDLKNEQLVIRSTVGEGDDCVTKVETRRLDEDEIRILSDRDIASRAELKDLLMKMHPDYFETYRVDGSRDAGRYVDPLGAFIRGEAPVRVENIVAKTKAKTNTKGVSPEREHSKKTRRSSGVSLS